MSGSLPRWLVQSPEQIPPTPYLTARPRRGASKGGARIGVVTSGSPAHANDANRSLDQKSALQLLSALGDSLSLDPMSTGARDMADTAEIIAGLELVITVDTSVAHLAGALGKPCWVMLPAVGVDWRWMRDRSDSPWYASLRLFRQAKPGDWSAVIDAIADQLNSSS
ncbi:hypothetical protein BH11PSE1_BH11PSE1_11340 [soil metagenome]